MPNERKRSIREAFAEASSFLRENGVLEPESNAQLLLEHLLGVDRTGLFLRWAEMFPVEHQAAWEQLLERKAAGEPVQYIRGEQEFYGLPFTVTPAVLIPRPETELLVERVVQLGRLLWPEAERGEGSGSGRGQERADAEPNGRGTSGAEAEANLRVETDKPLLADIREGIGSEQGQRRAESGVDVRKGPDGPSVADVGEGRGRELGLQGAQLEANVREGSNGPLVADIGEGRRRELGLQGAETEANVQEGSNGPLVADIGVGSGAIAVSLAVQCPGWRLVASDISPEALEVARGNSERHGLGQRVTFWEGDLLGPFIERGVRLDAVVSNPPYIPEADEAGLQPEVRLYEPRTALYGGADGLEPYRRLTAQLGLLPAMPALVGFEVGLGQAEAVRELLEKASAWDDIEIVEDLAGIARHVIAYRRTT